jgi:ABC-type glycerol-3-phosphate transport system substrate-binding protein
MKRSAVLAAALSCALLSGCAAISGHPQTAEEFRKAVPGAFLGEVESFEVNRPFSEVARTFQKKAPECLNVTIKTVSRTNMSYQVIVTTYKPTVLVNGQKAELHVQFHHDQGVMNVTKEPDGGYYLVVADLFPMGNDRTRVDLYRPSMGYDVLIKGIKGWAASHNSGCPDLTA